jgi:hypothetical protein
VDPDKDTGAGGPDRPPPEVLAGSVGHPDQFTVRKCCQSNDVRRRQREAACSSVGGRVRPGTIDWANWRIWSAASPRDPRSGCSRRRRSGTSGRPARAPRPRARGRWEPSGRSRPDPTCYR